MQFSINPKFVVDQVLEFWKKKKFTYYLNFSEVEKSQKNVKKSI